MKYGIEAKELLEKENKTVEELEFITNYITKSPVNVTNCTMNKIAKLFEKEFDTNNRHKVVGFDKEKFKTQKKYNTADYDSVKSIKVQYEKDTKNSILTRVKNITGSTSIGVEIDSRNTIIDFYNEKIHSLNINEEDLCNIVVDICYKNDKSKTFAWNVVGNTMVKNLILNTKNSIKIPISDINGDVKYCGKKFKITEVNYNEASL